MNKKRPAKVKTISILSIYLSIYWLILGFLCLFHLSALQVYGNLQTFLGVSVTLIMEYAFWAILIITLISWVVIYAFFNLNKWSLIATYIFQIIYIFCSISTPFLLPLTAVFSMLNIAVSIEILYSLNKSNVKQAFGW